MESEPLKLRFRFKDTSHNSVQTGIQCLRCGLTSWLPDDVSEHYCANCHEFGELINAMEAIPHLLKLDPKYL